MEKFNSMIDNFFNQAGKKSKAFCFKLNRKEAYLTLFGSSYYSTKDKRWVYIDNCNSEKLEIDSKITREEVVQNINDYLNNGKYAKILKKAMGLVLLDDDKYVLIHEKKKVDKIIPFGVIQWDIRTSGAGDPGGYMLSLGKFFDITHTIQNKSGYDIQLLQEKIQDIQCHIYMGDTQPAVVLSLNPFLIAAYSDELDGVLILKFPQKLLEYYNYSVGDHLTTVNRYRSGYLAPDIHPGTKYTNFWTDFIPIIPDFIAGNLDMNQTHKQKMSDELYDAVKAMGESYLEKYPNSYRDGFWYLK